MTFTGRVLALDLATTTGWAYGCPGSLPFFGHKRFSKVGTPRAETLRAFRDWLNYNWWDEAGDSKPDAIVYESPAVPSIMAGRTNIDTIRLLTGMAAHLEEWCVGKVTCSEASVSKVRTHFIGSNKKSAAAKTETMKRCQMLGWKVKTTDEADACALWHFQCGWLNPRLAALR